ncbi:MAG: bifunctional UDP-sugar hydrolase/5'-nucleotidase [Clostridia bacterium]|nr:bifunctional UDP-sugar hydrolase/5'-nucleotidase [Clostridia bacterium]
MKKLIALLLVLAMAFAVTGCSKQKAQIETLTTQLAEKTAEVETAVKEKAAALEEAAADKAKALEEAAADKVKAVEEAVAAKASELEAVISEKDAALEAVANAPADTIVLFTNDVHCATSDNLGYAGLATVKDAYKCAGYDVIVADIGDAVQGDAIGTLSKGEIIIDLMGEVGYDVATIGNHEFDYGMDQFKSNVARAKFPYVACNFVDAEGKAVVNPYIIKESNGRKIAFVGIATPKTVTTSTPKYFMNDAGEFIYSFSGDNLYEVVQATVDAARAEGADYVVALGHLGIEADCSPWTSSEVINNTTGIDAFLDGHSHSVLPCEIVKNKEDKPVLLSSTGTKLANIGCLTIKGDGTITVGLVNAAGVDGAVKAAEKQFDELLNQVVAHTDVELAIKDPATGERMVRQQETNLGDLCADAYQWNSGADVAIINGGGVRDTIPAGDITYGQIIKVHPFGNALCVVECTGEEIWQALELGCSKLPAESGGFLHISKNMTMTVDLNVPSPVVLDEKGLFQKLEGDHRVVSVTINGEPLDPAKTYTLACHNYKLKDMGDGYTMFADNNFLQDSVKLDNQVLIDYITGGLNGVVGAEYSDPYGNGRITIIPVAEVTEAPAEQPAA